MKKAKKIVVGNWKMNPESPEEARAVFAGIKRTAEKKTGVSVVICPPSIYLPLLAKNATAKVAVGVQDVFYKSAGAYTGEVSAVMMRQSGATHTIIGHSERRALGDTNEIVNKKIIAAFNEKLGVIFCIGEAARDTEGTYLEFIKQELVQGLAKVDRNHVSKLIVAYEPIWAIGKNERDAMKGAQMYEMTIYIRKIIGEIFDRSTATEVPILYGGSVSAFNAEDIIKNGHADGLLVGRQSLNAKDFGEILNIVNEIKSSE